MATPTSHRTPADLPLAQVSLRARERGLVVGGTGTGKSMLAEALIADWRDRYRSSNRKRSTRVLVVDTKPRFRAERTVTGASARRLYRHWSHGPTIAGSVLVHDPTELADAWRLGADVAIAQTDELARVPTMTHVLDAFLRDARATRPQLAYVDELLDFFGPSGQPVAGSSDSIRRIVRAGRERGVGFLGASQRTKQIPVQLVSELTKLYLFHLDHRDDVRRLYDAGLPDDTVPPDGEHDFVYWTKQARHVVWGPYRLGSPSI